MKRIFVNGREYRSVDDMPPHVRRIYEARARDGDSGREASGSADTEPAGDDEERLGSTVVEIDRSEVRRSGDAAVEHRTETRIVVDGKEYTDPDDLPPRARRLYEFMMSEVGGDADDGPSGTVGPGGSDTPDPANPELIDVSESRTVRHVHRFGAPTAERSSRRSGSAPDLVLIVGAVLLILFVISLLI